ncbi:hypothetical protein GeomeDRAFT_0851 [Geobacter metallireducens RCH3]|uniref:Uncharacterized protein n=2 Tax=Geobacter TaxID=28231 RepID=Q39Y96_GEOMG|nr:hypothetical protein Gmet_0535 [Geobacter metallireducens GS-15]EHP88189.1 hypothetical protein GeomeDRAFT_0851 [Geobacter metallireducens RCH3]MBT1075348.1 hypothetical protein [Geobacter grbiciae]
MPVPQQLGRGDRMGRGPYEKSGIIEDTGLPPGKAVHERFDIFFPVDEVEENGKWVTKPTASELDLEVKLWYLPFGTMNADPFLWHEFTKKVSISTTGK